MYTPNGPGGGIARNPSPFWTYLANRTNPPSITARPLDDAAPPRHPVGRGGGLRPDPLPTGPLGRNSHGGIREDGAREKGLPQAICAAARDRVGEGVGQDSPSPDRRHARLRRHLWFHRDVRAAGTQGQGGSGGGYRRSRSVLHPSAFDCLRI